MLCPVVKKIDKNEEEKSDTPRGRIATALYFIFGSSLVNYTPKNEIA
jgi:hypothetical protein